MIKKRPINWKSLIIWFFYFEGSAFSYVHSFSFFRNLSRSLKIKHKTKLFLSVKFFSRYPFLNISCCYFIYLLFCLCDFSHIKLAMFLKNKIMFFHWFSAKKSGHNERLLLRRRLLPSFYEVLLRIPFHPFEKHRVRSRKQKLLIPTRL